METCSGKLPYIVPIIFHEFCEFLVWHGVASTSHAIFDCLYVPVGVPYVSMVIFGVFLFVDRSSILFIPCLLIGNSVHMYE